MLLFSIILAMQLSSVQPSPPIVVPTPSMYGELPSARVGTWMRLTILNDNNMPPQVSWFSPQYYKMSGFGHWVVISPSEYDQLKAVVRSDTCVAHLTYQ